MATLEELNRIAASLPGVIVADDGFAFSVVVKGKEKGFAWVWKERKAPKQPKVANPDVFAISVPNLAVKDLLLQMNVQRFFTEPHYNGFPAILVRLSEISVDELEDIVTEAWRTKAPPQLQQLYDKNVIQPE